ncbi:MAG TPA: hypothetical protein VEJ16_13980 [Alphaproteobacteria bacterium]|nr:hypothetical protein [Alphaproteobacteria bacterium]
MSTDKNQVGQNVVLGPAQARFLLSLASRIVPEVKDAEDEVKNGLVSSVDHALALQTSTSRLLFKFLLFVLQWVTVPFTLHRLERLPPKWQDAVLEFFENAPLTVVRAGIWGVKTLIYLGYYGQESVERRIQYLPSKTDGNSKLEALFRQRAQ